jgi:flagella basal body P-ring formation protein FlgA
MKRILLLAAASAAFAGTEPARSSGADWTAQDLRRAVKTWLENNGRGGISEDEVLVDDRFRKPACADEPNMSARSARSSSVVVRCAGPNAWEIVVRVEGDAQKSVPAVVTGAARRPGDDDRKVVVAKANLTAGTILTVDVLEERAVDAPPGAAAIRSLEEAKGLRLVGAIAPGAVLTTRNVARAPHVLKGEPVTIQSGGSGFEVNMPGRAEADAYEGSLVSVRNMRSGAIVTGRLGPGGIVIVR